MNSSYITALPDDWERVARVFSAMGDATRQKILLLFEPGESISLSSLVATVGLSRTAVSHHVNVLVRAGLLIPRRQGREVLYRRDLPFAVEMLDRVRDYALAELARARATVPEPARLGRGLWQGSPPCTDAARSAHEQAILRQTVSLGVSYTLGTFNDNFFKQAILLLAVSMGHTAVQAWGTVLFSLPFVLFSAWAGWLADRYPKCRLVLAAKAREVCAMLAGGWGLLQLHWSGMLTMLFCMGASATLFSPALNGSLPELFAREDVPRVNALFKLYHHGLHPAGHHAGRRRPGTAMGRHGDPLRALAGGCRGRGRGGAGPALRVLHPLPSRCRPQGRSAALPWLGAWIPPATCGACVPARASSGACAAMSFSTPCPPSSCWRSMPTAWPSWPWPTMVSLLPGGLMLGICAEAGLAARRARGDWRRSVPRACAGIGLLLAVAGGVPAAPEAFRFGFALCLLCGGGHLRQPVHRAGVQPDPAAPGSGGKRAASSAPAISFPFPAWRWPGRSMPCCPSCRLPWPTCCWAALP